VFYRTELVVDGEGLHMPVDKDGDRLRCIATVSGLASNIVAIKMAVNCKSSFRVSIFKLISRTDLLVFDLSAEFRVD
jgi:hypothetical protein